MSKAGFVYAIRTGGAEFVKIGQAVDPLRRLNSFSSGCPLRLYLYAVIPTSDMNMLEQRIHAAMKEYHVNDCNGREWFYWTPEVRQIFRAFKKNPTHGVEWRDRVTAQEFSSLRRLCTGHGFAGSSIWIVDQLDTFKLQLEETQRTLKEERQHIAYLADRLAASERNERRLLKLLAKKEGTT